MKTISKSVTISLALAAAAVAQTESTTYTNFIRQVQLPSAVEAEQTTEDMTDILSSDQSESLLAINPHGARFELHTVSSDPFASYLLDTRYVGTYVPLTEVTIRTEDVNSLLPRTRADRPFYVHITVSGLRDGASDPEASKKVKLFHHTQSYGVTGDGTNIDRTQATLRTQSIINKNGLIPLTFSLTSIPGGDRSKVRGEERISVFSIADYQAPESQLSSQFVQIWPVADGRLSGITAGQTIGFATPTITIAANDLYPESTVYAQLYQGAKRDDGFEGVIIPGSAVVVNESVPQNRLVTVSNWGSLITADGTWTMELLTSTVFGIDRLSYVTFEVDRTISVNGSVTTIE